uniref:Ribonuclease H-like domain-containing protein n=1 Tax=Tanacetum cinerariifolium TaxID=118510 RepID=A0A6L2LHA2_TANCI|nr:ribonuclease H-like domain-containing protein [Tanacetum cinerariifolium]
MKSLSPQVVSAAKFPILNPNEFDLWKMRIEQYFFMTDYSLWEVIRNGDAPFLTRVIEGVVQPLSLTTAEQRLARKNELKARGTLLMTLPDKHQLKFNTHKDAKTLMETIKKQFGGNKETNKVQKTLFKQQFENFTGLSSESLDQIHDRLQNLINLEDQSLDDLFNSLTIYKAEVKSSSSAITSTLAFVSSQNTDSTNESVSDVTSVTAASAKVLVSALPNIDADALEEMDLKWQTTMLTMRARRFLHRTKRNLGANGTTSMGFDMSKCDGVGSYDWSFQADEEPTNYALMAFTTSSSSSSDNETGLESVEARLLVYQQNKTVFEEDIKLLKLYVELRDKALVALRKKFEKSEQEKDDLSLKLEKFQTSSKNLSQILASQTNDKTGLGYDTQVFTSSMFDCDEMLSSEFDVSLPASPLYDRYHSGEGYHVVLPPYTGTFMPPKPDLVFHDTPNVTVFDLEDESKVKPILTVLSFVQPIPAKTHRKSSPKTRDHRSSRNRKACFVCKSLTYLIKYYDYFEKKMVQHVRNHAMRGTNQHYASLTNSQTHRHVVPTAVLTKSMLVPLTAARPVNVAVSQPYVTRPQTVKNVVTKSHSPPRRTIKRRPYPKTSTFPQKVTTAKAPQANPQYTLQDKGVIDSGCSRHMTGNMSYLFDFKSINGGYVAFGENPKGGKITGKGKIRTGKLDFDDVYFFKELKFNLFNISHMCDKKNSVLFTDTKCIVLSSNFKLPDESHVLLRVPRENNMYNVDLKNIVHSGDLTCLFVKATLDESNLWHRRLGHINFKTMNKMVQGNLVRGLPSNVFENDHTCVACKKGKQHRASYPLGKFDRKVDKRFLVGYSVSSKAFRVFNNGTRIVQETLHINFLENKPNVAGSGPTWIFDIDSLTKSMNYQLVSAGNQPHPSACVQDHFDAEKAGEEHVQQYVHFPSCSAKTKKHNDKTKIEAKVKSHVELYTGIRKLIEEFEDFTDNSTNKVNAPVLQFLLLGKIQLTALTPLVLYASFGRYTYSDDEKDVGAEADFTNLETTIIVNPILTTRVHRDHPSLKLLEEGIDYKKVFAPVVRIEAIRLFLAYDSFMGFMVYQMDVKSAFLYGTIEEEVYVCQPPRFEDPDYPDKVYKVVKTLYGLHQAPRAWYEILANYLLENGFQKGKIDQTLFIKRQKGRKSASTPINTEKPLLKDSDCEDVDVHTYRYLKGKTYLGLWYPKDSPFNLVAYSDSDYASASLDKKSTTGGCQFLRCRLISWQCKKQTVVATSSTEAEKKVIITEDTVREALHLDDADSIDYLPNEEIFAELVRMGYKKPSKKLTFYKAFFLSQ